MNVQRKTSFPCPHCGRALAATDGSCPVCGRATVASAAGGGDDQDARTIWAREAATIKTQWVLAVLAFWVTLAVQIALYLIRGELSFILLSIAAGMMFLGVGLKIRLQLHLRREPKKTPG